MAEDKNATSPDDGAVIPRLKLSETGYTGLRISDKQIYEEQARAFRYPFFIKTVNEMRHNPTVGSAMNVYRFMMNRVKWSVEAPNNATDVEKKRAEIVKTMMDDMEDMTWADFISSVIPYLEYGFAVNEIVLRRRLHKNGSKYNDGLVGIRKLPTRSQDTISGWEFDSTGNNLLAVEQSLAFMQNASRFTVAHPEGKIRLPIEKILLFTASKVKGNPEGNSLYKNIYLAYKQLTLLQEQQLQSIARDVQGILKIEIPPQYLSPEASDDQKAVVEGFKKVIDGYNNGTQRGLLLPNVIDPESKLKMFDYNLLESRGSLRNNTESIIKGYQNDILTALSVDILRLGADGSGSFSLAESKSSILSLAIDYRLREIAAVLNHSLMKTIYQMNGWDTENLPSFVYEDIEEVDLGTFSQAIQRITAVGAIEMDREFFNLVRRVLGVKERPSDEPVNKDILPGNMVEQQSRSGDGMKPGTVGDGTAKSVGPQDRSTANKEN